MLIYDDISKKCHVTFKKNVFLKVLSYLVCVLSFKSINSSSFSRKKYDRGSFIPTPCQRLQVHNTSVGIELIELTEPSGTLNG